MRNSNNLLKPDATLFYATFMCCKWSAWLRWLHKEPNNMVTLSHHCNIKLGNGSSPSLVLRLIVLYIVNSKQLIFSSLCKDLLRRSAFISTCCVPVIPHHRHHVSDDLHPHPRFALGHNPRHV